MNDKVWIVGRYFWQLDGSSDSWNWTWDLHGIFHIKQDAVELCEDEHWFIGRVPIDQPFPNEPVIIPDFAVPNSKKADPLQRDLTEGKS